MAREEAQTNLEEPSETIQVISHDTTDNFQVIASLKVPHELSDINNSPSHYETPESIYLLEWHFG